MKSKEIHKLIKRAKEYDQDAFTKLMQLYMNDMYRVSIAILLNDEDVADAIQDTILSCWQKIHSLRHVKYFRTWMTRILINHCYAIRNKNKNLVSLDVMEEPVVEQEIKPLEKMMWKDLLSKLDEKYRVPILLFYGQGYKIVEIARMLELPQSTIQTRLSRGRQRLARLYGIEQENQDGNI